MLRRLRPKRLQMPALLPAFMPSNQLLIYLTRSCGSGRLTAHTDDALYAYCLDRGVMKQCEC